MSDTKHTTEGSDKIAVYSERVDRNGELTGRCCLSVPNDNLVLSRDEVVELISRLTRAITNG